MSINKFGFYTLVANLHEPFGYVFYNGSIPIEITIASTHKD